MKIQVISDIHLEFHSSIPSLFNSPEFIKAPYLFLLGDIAIPKKHPYKWLEFIAWATSNYSQIFYLIGNHESYGYSLDSTITFIKEKLSTFQNITFLERGVIAKLEDYTVIGCTLWTDIDFSTALIMNDIHNIKDSQTHKKISLATLQSLYQQDKEWLETTLSQIQSSNTQYEQYNKIIVATHHMPSMKLIAPKFQTPENMKYARGFASNLDHLLPLTRVWLYGHTHTYTNTIIDNTLCYCNPLGYPDESTDFKIECLDI